MRLQDWLKLTRTRKSDLARRLAVSPGRVTQLLAGERPSLELALKIRRVTENLVTPEDFRPSEDDMDKRVNETGERLDSVESAIAAIRRGEMIVVVDDDDRENEGDLIAAASRITPEQMAFMVRHTSGIVCAPMPGDVARRLKLDPMVSANDAPLGTAFTVTIDYREGLTTGISAKERCATVHALANANVQAADFVRPGHVFPLIARDGGVLVRSGHTEAAVDLCRIAGEPPVGVICELVNDDGTVKRGAQVQAFARDHRLKIISVADLIAYRQARERLVERAGTFAVETPAGIARGIAFSTPFDPVQHVALVFGDIGDGRTVPVRLHRATLVDDVFGARAALNAAYGIFRAQGRGVLVYLRDGTAGVAATPIGDKAAGQGEQHGSVKAREQAWRDVGVGAQILKDLGVRSIRLIASRNRHYVGLSGFDIEIAGTDLIDA